MTLYLRHGSASPFLLDLFFSLSSGKNRRYCDAIIGDCRHIPHACDPNAECVFSTKFGKSMRVYKCECKDGYTGNGVQCFDQDGNLSSNNMEVWEIRDARMKDFSKRKV